MSSRRLDGLDVFTGGGMSDDGPTGQAGDFFALAGTLRAFKAGPLDGRPSDRALAEAAWVARLDPCGKATSSLRAAA